jgi:anti-sigma factor RsiW
MDMDRLDAEARREALVAYLDGELSPADARAVTAWLTEHPDVLADVERDRRIWELLDAYRDEPVPAGFAERVLGATAGPGHAAEARAAVGRPRAWRVPLAAAAAVLVGLGAGFLLRGADDEPTVAPPTETALAAVPPEMLEHADVLLALSEDEFDMLVLGEGDDPADPLAGG